MKFCWGVIFFWITWGSPFAKASEASHCDDLNHAKTLYQSGAVDDAIAELKDLKKKCPNSVDVIRLLSDIDWWEGAIADSTDEANQGFGLLDPDFNSFDDNKLHFADRLHPIKLRASFAELSANQSTGQDYSIEGDARIVGRQHLLFGAYRTSRIYDGSGNVSDTRFELGHVFSYGKSGYWENNFSYSPLATIYARFGFATTPHWVSANDFDYFVSAKFSHYETDVPNTDQVVSFSPGFSHTLGDQFAITLQEIATHSDHWIYATQGTVHYFTTSRLSFEAGLAFGHVIEGPGLEGNFKSLNLGLKFRVNPTLALIPNQEIYRGSVRDETATALSLEVRL